MKNRIFYGWFITAACFMMLFVSTGLMSNNFSIFMPPIREEYGLTHAQTSSFVTLRNIFSFLATFVIAKFYDKFSLRIGMTISVAFCGVAYFWYSVSSVYPMFCIAASLSGFGMGLASMFPASILMNSWFITNRALALGICSAGSGVAMMVMPGITTALIASYGISGAFRIEATLIMILGVLVFFIVRNTPGEKGLTALGYEEHGHFFEQEEGPKIKKTNKELAAQFPKLLWVFALVSLAFNGALANPGYAHLSVLFADAGFEAGRVALMISGVGLVLTLAKLAYGRLVDTIGGFRTNMIFGWLLFIGHIFCCMAYSKSMAVSVAIMICMGIGYVITSLGYSVMAQDLFPGEAFPMALRRLSLISSGLSLVFSTVPGILADIFGSYVPTYALFAVFTFITVITLRIAYKIAAKVNI